MISNRASWLKQDKPKKSGLTKLTGKYLKQNHPSRNFNELRAYVDKQ